MIESERGLLTLDALPVAFHRADVKKLNPRRCLPAVDPSAAACFSSRPHARARPRGAMTIRLARE